MKYHQTKRQFIKAVGLGAASLAAPQAILAEELKAKLKAFRERTNDPWVTKWEHE